MPDVMGSLLGGLTDIFGRHAGDEYEKKFGALSDRYNTMQPNLKAEQQNFDEPTRNAMLDAMGKYGNIANQGGLDAIGRSQIADSTAETGRNADAMANSIQARARAGGVGNSGVTMALAQGAGQGEADRGALEGSRAAAGAQGRQLGALSGYFGAAQGAGGAADAINRFNANLRQRTTEGNFQRGMDVAGGIGDATQAAYGAAQGNQNQWRRGLGSVGHSIDEGYEVMKDWMPGGGGKGKP